MSYSDELCAAADPIWEAQHAHPFVRGIGNGSLDLERFRHYVRQDYLFLIDYGRLLALARRAGAGHRRMARFAELTQSVLVTEMDLHRAFAAELGIGDLERGPGRRPLRALDRDVCVGRLPAARRLVPRADGRRGRAPGALGNRSRTPSSPAAAASWRSGRRPGTWRPGRFRRPPAGRPCRP